MAEEKFDEHDASGMPENLHPPEIKGSENDDLGVGEEKRWPGWPGENVFRMLVPVQKVGAIIGRKGECIKKICEETKARIKILDGPPGITERAVMISAKEEPGVPIPPAVDGLLKVHKRVVEVDNDAAAAHAVCTRLLVAAVQGSSLIGKQGATIKSIQEATNCAVRVRGKENLPPVALADDSIVEIQGEPTNVHKAVELIATHLRKFLVDRSVIGIFEMQMQMPNPRANQDMPPTQSWGPSPQDFHMNAGGPGFMPNLQYMPPPPHQFDSYYRPPDMPPFDNQQPPFDNQQPRQGPPVYGRDASMGSHPASMQPQHSIVTKVSQNMQIPLSYADVVIGISGANISYIRRVSGATIAVQETKGVPGEMTVEINGSASQVQTAQQLIQNSVAEAASAAQNPAGGPPQAAPAAAAAAGQGYNSYAADNSYPAANGTVYASQPSNGGGYESAGGCGPVYGANYGY